MSARDAEFAACRVLNVDQHKFPELSYEAFVYPGDDEALAALKRVPGAPSVLTFLQKHITEELSYIEHSQQMIRANESCYRTIYRLVLRCAEILDCPPPEVFITQNPILNAETSGQRHTHIVIHSALIERMTANELAFVIGHELGHIKCGHGLYRQLGDLLIQYWDMAAGEIPGAGFVRMPLVLAYWEWYRRAELTCDRAGLLCVQDLLTAQSALSKLSGQVSGFEDEINIQSAMSQADSDREVSKLSRILFILSSTENTHPFVPVRLKKLQEFYESEQFKTMLQGFYKRDPLGLHEGGPRFDCNFCKKEFNAKFNQCPYCRRPSQLAVQGPPQQVTPYCVKCNIPVAQNAVCHRCGGTVQRLQPKKNWGFI